MQSRWIRRLGLAALAGSVVWGSVGCAQERDPINRVQANALSKHFFVGADLSNTKDDPEFYMRNTVVDVPYGASQDGLFTASYAQPLSRVKWEISEKTLIARQTYEHVQDSDGNGSRTTDTGQVVAMFAISSHFDIKREYNAQTGEESNVIEENSTDRPWYEREFFRVDWSQNQVTDGYEVDTLSEIGIFGGIKFDPMSYYIEDPNDPNAPVFNEQDGYFDITSKAFATPQTIEFPFGLGKFPLCFFPMAYGGSAPIGNCNPTEVTLRLSFKKVVDTDYEPTDWDGKRQDAFGWFTVDRYGYERNYGVIDEKWHHFAAKYNLWQQSHITGSQCAVDFWRDADGNVAKYKVDGDGNFLADPGTGLPIPDANGKPFQGTPIGADPHRDTDHNGTEDECEFRDRSGNIQNEGARCDDLSKKCSLPFYARQLKTIPWYYGADAPADLFASTARALDQWNVAVKRAAQIGRAVEAKRVNIDVDEDKQAAADRGALYIPTTEDALIADAGKDVPQVFTLCHNPVIATDHPACGKPGLLARIGDIRYNIVNMINTPQTPSPWGIMVDADDPLTGEKVATSVNEWASVLDVASQGTEDLLRWINGEISDSDITSGKYLRDWANASKIGLAANLPKALDAKEIKTRLASLDTSIQKLNGLTPADAALPRDIQRKKAAANLAQNMGPSLDPLFQGNQTALIGTKFETQLVTPDLLQFGGMDPSTPVSSDDSLLSRASPLRGLSPAVQRWINMTRGTAMASRASCAIEQPEPDSLVGLARQAQKLYPLPDPKAADYPALKNKRDQDLHQWIREQFHVSVIAHEMGHSMGLRHNFTGTYDALNYHTEYWQLRTRNGQEHFCGYQNSATDTLDAKTPHTNGADCVGPRWIDPVTDQEVNGLIWKWGSTTVMDYPGDQTQDMNDIGLYDKAAMRFGYVNVVDVDTDAVLPKSAKGVPTIDFQGQTDKGSAYAMALDGFGGIGGQSLGGKHYSTFADKYHPLGKCSSQADPNDPLTAKCSGFPLDYVSIRDMTTLEKYGPGTSDHLPGTLANYAVDPKGRVRHPYMFGSDEFADTGNVPVFRFDTGADSYEQFQFLISTYENRYVFDNFRRDRSTFNSHTVANRSLDRYFSKIQGMTKSLALLVELGQPTDVSDPGLLMPLALGASDGLAMFARILTRPEPGAYQVADPADTGMQLPYGSAVSNNYITLPPGNFQIALGSGEGRYLHNDYDYNQGYYWSDYQTQVGSYYEKFNAIYLLTEAENHFIANSKDDYIDGRYKNLNYSSIYPNQIRRLFAQFLQNDPMTLGPYVVAPGGVAPGTGPVHVEYLPWEKYDTTEPTTVALDYKKDAVVLNPLVGWEQQYPMLVNAFIYSKASLTNDFIDQMRIWSPGGIDTVDVPIDQQVHYRDPQTGFVYAARFYGNETINAKHTEVQRGLGARMLQYANQIAAQYFVVASTDPVTGEMTYQMDPATGTAACKDVSVCFTGQSTLKNYSANLDTMRELGGYLGYGFGHDPAQPHAD